ncbi:MAG: D-glycero-beta-D-manno-heptose-7-phosphate kinase, partial [Helicobacter sp.]|nr:D-glycero-beta-D-manno-heptose-7-phosphate kinase [Helicobacter sp.]
MEGAFFDSLEAHAPCVLVVGDVMIDHYVWGECERISPEAPVAVVDVKSESRRLGGACNVMHNLLALGASVIPCGVVGDDSVGAEIRNKLSEMGIDTAGLVSQDNRLSTQKTRIIASNQQVVRVDWEQRHDISAQSEERILAFVRQAIEHVDCVVLSDYAKGVLTSSLTPQIIALANAANKRVLVDPKGSDYRKYRGATLLTPNKKEAQSATGIALARGDDLHLKQALLALREQCALAYPLITLSEEGIGILHNDELLRVPTIAREVYDVTGAGDTVIAALAFVLCCGESIVRAVQFANAAAC